MGVVQPPLGSPSMKAGVLASGRVHLEEVAAPRAGPGEIVVAMRASGICGTDLEKARGNYRATGRIGHEPTGIVSEVGSGVNGISAGMRVFVHHHVPCYACPVCRSGMYTFCPTYQSTNIDPGGFAEFFRVPEPNVRRGAVLPLPDALTDEEGTFIEPLGCCLEALWATPFQPGMRALVIGLGPIGLLYLRLLRAAGASGLAASDLSPARRKAALASGADVVFDPREAPSKASPQGGTSQESLVDFDLVVVATGAPQAIADGIQRCRRGGTVNLFGLPERGSHLETDMQELYLRGIRLVPTYATTERGTSHALELLASRRVVVRDLITHRFPLDQLPEAFAMAARTEEAIKVVVTAGAGSGVKPPPETVSPKA